MLTYRLNHINSGGLSKTYVAHVFRIADDVLRPKMYCALSHSDGTPLGLLSNFNDSLLRHWYRFAMIEKHLSPIAHRLVSLQIIDLPNPEWIVSDEMMRRYEIDRKARTSGLEHDRKIILHALLQKQEAHGTDSSPTNT